MNSEQIFISEVIRGNKNEEITNDDEIEEAGIKIIKKVVEEVTGLAIDRPTRIKKYVTAKKLFSIICAENGIAMKRISKSLGRHRTVAYHLVKEAKYERETNPFFIEKYEECDRLFKTFCRDNQEKHLTS